MNKLLFLAAKARKEESWLDFSRFCELRGQGVRAAAMEELGKFLKANASAPFERRLTFSRWLLRRSREFQDVRVLLPHPILEQFVVPTLRQWCEACPREAEPHLWLGLLMCDIPSDHLDQALELDPSCELARQTLTNWILGHVDYNQHELPSFYINDAEDDLTALDKASELTSASKADGWVKDALREIAELRARAEDWVATHPRANKVVAFPDESSPAVPVRGK
jgi:hypothetical protein